MVQKDLVGMSMCYRAYCYTVDELRRNIISVCEQLCSNRRKTYQRSLYEYY